MDGEAETPRVHRSARDWAVDGTLFAFAGFAWFYIAGERPDAQGVVDGSSSTSRRARSGCGSVLGAPGASDEQLRESLDVVGAGDLPERLDDGLDTKVGGRDHALTPAEVQQVALARVILAAPEVVVLDEATSMLSPNAASDIEQGLNRILAGRTVVSIAHRLNTAHDADRVAVVEHGRITELGSHDELLKRGGAYAALWSRWHG